MKSAKVLVTGASGFVGGALSSRLLENSIPLRCQYRRGNNTLKQLEHRGAELVQTDLSPPLNSTPQYQAMLENLVQGVETLYHSAAYVSDWGPKEAFVRTNFEATRLLFEAAQKAGVKRFIFVSSLAVHGFGRHRGSTEEGPWYPLVSHYQSSKKMAEDYILNRSEKNAPMACVIRPGNVYGPGDTTTTFKIFDAMRKGIMGYIDGGRALTSPIYIDDLLNVLLIAGSRDDIAGEAFNITSGEVISWREYLELAAGALHVRKPSINLPKWIAKLAGHLMNGLWTVARANKGPALTPYRVDMVINDYNFDTSKARTVLGFNAEVSSREGMIKTAESYWNTRGNP
ncbi:MAG: hypothetical protein B0D92_04220 [Spirochaeta sp. LUC14_002_19_P3]|nr:MAG: hypothetical protein B0D92_04220 [Spirochaeta sp. LUC14_002_19_P3]